MVDGFLNIINKSSPQGSNKKSSIGSTIFIGRVNNVILSDQDEGWEENGEYASVGYIYFSNPTVNNPTAKNVARPLFSNQKLYPILNELIYIIGLPSTDINRDPSQLTFYYFQPINIWNSNHHNAIPDEIFNQQLPDSQKQDYPTVGLGAVRRVTDESTEIDLGATFKEKSNIKTLQPYEGDYILEGRWGNSIRFGSTVINSYPSNTWSSTGNNGDPLIIIRNGQYNDEKDAWVPTVEDINQDSGSIYLTTTQKINLTPASQNYNSYSTQPTSINQYINPQIILNSGRLVFNSSQDNILLTSKKTVGLNAVESVNIDTKQTIINSSQIFLGGKDATESVLKGDTTVQILSDLLTELINLTTALVSVTPQGGPLVNPAATQLLPELVSIKTRLETQTKSNISKTL
jgi:hypothetical protein